MSEARPSSDPAALPPSSATPVLGGPTSQDSSVVGGVVGYGLPANRPLEGPPGPVSQEKIISRRVSRRSVRKHRLKPTQEAFIKHYTDPNSPTFGNGKQAYLKAHPNVTQGTAGVLGSTILDNPRIQAAVREELQAQGFGKDEAIEGLVWNIRTSQTQGKLSDHREGTKVYLQATGNWKEVQEITHLDDAQKDAIRRTVSEALGSN